MIPILFELILSILNLRNWVKSIHFGLVWQFHRFILENDNWNTAKIIMTLSLVFLRYNSMYLDFVSWFNKEAFITNCDYMLHKYSYDHCWCYIRDNRFSYCCNQLVAMIYDYGYVMDATHFPSMTKSPIFEWKTKIHSLQDPYCFGSTLWHRDYH